MLTDADLKALRDGHPRGMQISESCREQDLEYHATIHSLLDEIERLKRPEFCDCIPPDYETVAVVGRGTDLLCRKCGRYGDTVRYRHTGKGPVIQ